VGVSERKAQASRENGRGSKGPVSPEGKSRTRLNAVRFGLFSQELVVAAAGETQEDADALRSSVWNYIQPQDPVTALLVNDFVNTVWRLQRPRRCETAEIRRRTDTARYRRHFDKISEVDSLKGRFMRDYVKLCSSGLERADREALSLSLGETRKHLAQTSLGLEFLIGLIQAIETTVEICGFFSASAALTLLAACGEEDECAQSCVTLNELFKREVEKSKKAKAADKTTLEQNKLVLSELLKSQIRDMRMKQNIFRKLESVEEEAYLASLVMPPAECSEKIHRAEAALERRFYKTLNYLLALQGVKLSG
jgi:hypothetical protein